MRTTTDHLNRKQDVTDKKHQGRPKALPPELDMRFQIRCSHEDIDAWKERAAQLVDSLVHAALAAVERCERRRLARGTTPQPLSYTDDERAWFRRPLSL